MNGNVVGNLPPTPNFKPRTLPNLSRSTTPDPLPPLPLVRTPLQFALNLIQQITPVITSESSEYRSWRFNGSRRGRQYRLTLCCPALLGITEVVSVVCTLPGRTKAYTLVIIKNQSVSVWL